MSKPNLVLYKFSNEMNGDIPLSGVLILSFDTLIDIYSGTITFEVIDLSGNSDITYNVLTSCSVVDYKLNSSDINNTASYISLIYSGLIHNTNYALKINAAIVRNRDDGSPNDQVYQTIDSSGLTQYTIRVKGNQDLISNAPTNLVFDVSTSPLVSANANVITIDLSTVQLSPYTKYRLKFDDGAILSTTGEVFLYDNFPEYTFTTGA